MNPGNIEKNGLHREFAGEKISGNLGKHQKILHIETLLGTNSACKSFWKKSLECRICRICITSLLEEKNAEKTLSIKKSLKKIHHAEKLPKKNEAKGAEY